MKQSNLEKYNDFELVYLAKENNEMAYEILQKKYEPIIVGHAKRYNKHYINIGLDIHDYIIEGRIALDHAINNFDENYDCIFFTHALNYIKYNMLSLVKKNKKDRCLNNAIEWQEQLVYNVIDTNSIHNKELIKTIFSKLNKIERKVLMLRVKGYSYDDIAYIMNTNKKKIDNILFKIRKLLRRE